MARCACGNAACSCVIKSKPNGGIVVTGSGSPERPYEISTVAGGNPLDSLTVADTATLDLHMAGAGTPEDKRRISGTVIAKVRDLTDVSKTDTPVVGDVIQWNGSEWVFASPGATSVPVSGTWGTPPLDKYGADSLIGPSIYLDSNGQIRTRPHVLAPAAFTAATLASSYPLGVSLMQLSSTDTAQGSGWPIAGVFGIVETSRTGPSNVVQRFIRTTTGTNQIVMVRSGSDTAWGSWQYVGGLAPHYSAFKSASQALTAANTSYTITYDSVVTNVGFPAISYAAGVFTVGLAGDYEITINHHLQRTATTSFTGYLYVGGVNVQTFSWSLTANGNIGFSKVVRCAAGDQIYFQLRANVTGGVAYGSSTRYSTIDITLVGG